MTKMGEALSIQAAQATAVGTRPHHPMCILDNVSMWAGVEAIGIMGVVEVMGEDVPIKTIQAAFCANPQLARRTDKERRSSLAAQAVGILRIVTIGGEFCCSIRPPIDPGRSCANPQRAGGIFVGPTIIDNIAAQAGG